MWERQAALLRIQSASDRLGVADAGISKLLQQQVKLSSDEARKGSSLASPPSQSVAAYACAGRIECSPLTCPATHLPTPAGKKLLDDMKKSGDTMTVKNPKAERLQPYKSQYMRLCKLYVDVMKEHQRSKVRPLPPPSGPPRSCGVRSFRC